jgi:hypothetical protein
MMAERNLKTEDCLTDSHAMGYDTEKAAALEVEKYSQYFVNPISSKKMILSTDHILPG